MFAGEVVTAELLAGSIRAVAAAKRPRDALTALLAAVRVWTGASGASLLWTEQERLVPAASHGLAPPPSEPKPHGQPATSLRLELIARERLEGYLLLASVQRPAAVETGDFQALLDLAALALRDSRIE